MEPFHIPMSRWCEHANDHIKELERERDDLKESNDTWLEVASTIGRELDMTPTYAIARAPERIQALKAQLAWTGDRLRERIEELIKQRDDILDAVDNLCDIGGDVPWPDFINWLKTTYPDLAARYKTEHKS